MSLHKFHIIGLGLLLFVASGGPRAQGFGPAVNDAMPPEHLPADLHTYPNQDNFGKLEGGGRLLEQELDPKWLFTLTYFPRGSRRGLMLRDSLRAINVFLAAEVRRPKTVQTFLKEHLLLFLEDTLADDGAVPITPDSEWGSDTTEAPHPSAAKRARLFAKIKSYELPAGPLVSGNVWTVDVNVLTNHGALDHWLVKGSVRPLRIDSFLCEPKEPEGTFYPILYH